MTFEELYAEKMRDLAEKEGRVGLLPKSMLELDQHKCASKYPSAETFAAVQLLAERPMTSEQIGVRLGISGKSVSSRLSSLQDDDVVEVVGTIRHGKWHTKKNVWSLGPRGNEWLKREAKRRAA